MPRIAKLLIGLVAALFAAWLCHGPLGSGERLAGALQARAQAVVAREAVPGVAVRIVRDPLSRTAILSGPADDFQRRGMGSKPGLTGIVADVEGIGAVRWSDEARGDAALPLLAETGLLAVLAYFVGLAASRLLWGRRKKTNFLGD